MWPDLPRPDLNEYAINQQVVVGESQNIILLKIFFTQHDKTKFGDSQGSTILQCVSGI
jgi:hypothetical protein